MRNSRGRSFTALGALSLLAGVMLWAEPAVAAITPTPDVSLSLPVGTSPWDVEEGPDGRLYVTDTNNGVVLAYPLDATATTQPVATFHVKDSSLAGIAAVGLSFAPDGRMFVTNGLGGTVFSFSAADVLNVAGDHDVVADATTFVINSTVLDVMFHSTYMYVFAYDLDEIWVYDMTSNLLYMFVQSTTGLNFPTTGVVVGDQLVVSNNHGIADGSGMLSWLPLASIEGQGSTTAAPGLNVPETKRIDSLASLSNFTDYVAKDCNDNLIVTNYGGYPAPIYVNKFSPDATIDSAPIDSITGDGTELATAEGVEVDSHDHVWVAQTSGAVLRFDSFADQCDAAALPNTGENSNTAWSAVVGALVLGVAGVTLLRNRRRA
ncbi:unannotated protein [freshwater metagenome]|uniref:Unannotated protein n=1 Tax=freshwater metagenome TaxID=449393 RepID=A0A6J6EIB4_9ZZZZ|nr:LPXTG cell wall anchor domain-containing protein [Actinomycetota bacterium]